MKKILVLIEEEKNTSKTINWALQHAGSDLTSIVLAYVIPPSFQLQWNENDLEKRKLEWKATQEKERLALLDWKYFLTSQGYEVSIIKIDGTRIYNLTNILDKEEFDLLVMSAKGRSWLEDKIMGSPWSELIAHAKMPIFLIPKEDIKLINPINKPSGYQI